MIASALKIFPRIAARESGAEGGVPVLPPFPPAKPWDGDHVDVDMFYAEAWAELRIRQNILSRGLRLVDATWTVNQAAGIITFEREDGALVTSPVQIIGSWSARNETFTWGWDHPSVHVRLRAGAERTRWFGEKHGLCELTERHVRATETDAWRLTAVAVKVNGSAGAYRGPTEAGPAVFMALGEPKLIGF